MRPTQIHAALSRAARQRARPFPELLTLYALERFLGRLTTTHYADNFVLKGGVLLAAYQLRRPTKDIDMQAQEIALDVEHLTRVVAAVAAIDVDDGLLIDAEGMQVEQIRDEDGYSGIRVHIPARIHTFKLDLLLDVSTGDPIWPEPERVSLPSVLDGEKPVVMLGHPMATVIAEKTVTMLQRGTTSTRWRDLHDVRALARTYWFIAAELREAAEQVASFRKTTLGPVATVLGGYGAVSQPKWSAWARRQSLRASVHASLDEQVADVVAFIDPVFAGELDGDARWNPDTYEWVGPTK